MKPVREWTDDELHDSYVAMRLPASEVRLLAKEVLRLRAALDREGVLAESEGMRALRVEAALSAAEAERESYRSRTLRKEEELAAARADAWKAIAAWEKRAGEIADERDTAHADLAECERQHAELYEVAEKRLVRAERAEADLAAAQAAVAEARTENTRLRKAHALQVREYEDDLAAARAERDDMGRENARAVAEILRLNADLAAARAGADPTPIPENAEWTPGQWIHGFLARDAAGRLEWAERVIKDRGRLAELENARAAKAEADLAAARAEKQMVEEQLRADRREMLDMHARMTLAAPVVAAALAYRDEADRYGTTSVHHQALNRAVDAYRNTQQEETP